MQISKEKQGEKKAFLSDQCKEIEENNRMGKTRDLFQKISIKMHGLREKSLLKQGVTGASIQKLRNSETLGQKVS